MLGTNAYVRLGRAKPNALSSLRGVPLRHATCNHRCAVILTAAQGSCELILSQFGLPDNIYSAANESRVRGLRALLAADR